MKSDTNGLLFDALVRKVQRLEDALKVAGIHAGDCHGADVAKGNRWGGVYYIYDPERCTCWIENN